MSLRCVYGSDFELIDVPPKETMSLAAAAAATEVSYPKKDAINKPLIKRYDGGVVVNVAATKEQQKSSQPFLSADLSIVVVPPSGGAGEGTNMTTWPTKTVGERRKLINEVVKVKESKLNK